MAATTLNVVYWHIRNILLLLLYHSYFYFCANLPGSRFSLSCDYKGPIHTNVYDCNYLLKCSLLALYILTNTGDYWISSSVLNLVLCKIPLRKYQKIFIEWFPAQKFPAILLHCLYQIPNPKPPLYPK